MPSHSDDLVIERVHLAVEDEDPGALYDVHCSRGRVVRVQRLPRGHWERFMLWWGDSWYTFGAECIDAGGRGILLPSLCHAHIHLDKCFLFDQPGHPPLRTGDFQEALQVTSEAKARFFEFRDDAYARGRRLIVQSIMNGVTAMRAHVEVDEIVGLQCLKTALKLKREFRNRCEIQIAVFAQDPLFESTLAKTSGANYEFLRDAARTPGVSAIGSAPYVERTRAQGEQNIALVLQLARDYGLLVDFHLDYDLNPSKTPLIHHLLQLVRAQDVKPEMITIGHGTHYSLFSESEWDAFRQQISGLPVSLVALPQSDLYMMGRTKDPSRLAPRGTLPVPFIASIGLNIALSVNNVGNAFTPQGFPDPLALCTLGVATYQDATVETCRLLLKSVSVASKAAIGLGGDGAGLVIREGQTADFVLLHDNNTVQSAVLRPSYARTTIRNGAVIAKRRVSRWLRPQHETEEDTTDVGRRGDLVGWAITEGIVMLFSLAMQAMRRYVHVEIHHYERLR
ncbi:hypothetical protein BC834DRAFT_863300 [Gloeopeniophorella convolvens]|nr:hypothetical protein BC834DRAFT_863300 [Gloeopeniophorella convolvens]